MESQDYRHPLVDDSFSSDRGLDAAEESSVRDQDSSSNYSRSSSSTDISDRPLRRSTSSTWSLNKVHNSVLKRENDEKRAKKEKKERKKSEKRAKNVLSTFGLDYRHYLLRRFREIFEDHHGAPTSLFLIIKIL